MFYKPKHHKKKFNFSTDKIHAVLNFIFEETAWYITWWAELIAKFFQKLYQFGEWIIVKSVKLIDLHDQFWDWFEEQFN